MSLIAFLNKSTIVFSGTSATATKSRNGEMSLMSLELISPSWKKFLTPQLCQRAISESVSCFITSQTKLACGFSSVKDLGGGGAYCIIPIFSGFPSTSLKMY